MKFLIYKEDFTFLLENLETYKPIQEVILRNTWETVGELKSNYQRYKDDCRKSMFSFFEPSENLSDMFTTNIGSNIFMEAISGSQGRLTIHPRYIHISQDINNTEKKILIDHIWSCFIVVKEIQNIIPDKEVILKWQEGYQKFHEMEFYIHFEPRWRNIRFFDKTQTCNEKIIKLPYLNYGEFNYSMMQLSKVYERPNDFYEFYYDIINSQTGILVPYESCLGVLNQPECKNLKYENKVFIPALDDCNSDERSFYITRWHKKGEGNPYVIFLCDKQKIPFS